MKYILLISLLIINGCTPLFSAGGLMHSVVTNNTMSTILGLSDTAIKEKTGKFGEKGQIGMKGKIYFQKNLHHEYLVLHTKTD